MIVIITLRALHEEQLCPGNYKKYHITKSSRILIKSLQGTVDD